VTLKLLFVIGLKLELHSIWDVYSVLLSKCEAENRIT